MTSENHDQLTETDASDAQSDVTSQREVPPTHGGPGLNWSAVVVAITAVIVFGILGFLFVATLG